jgi:hypothetical protein
MKRDVWDKRRRRLDIALLFIAAWVSWVIFKDSGTATSTQALMVLVPGGVGLIGSYIFGAVWDYKVYSDALKSQVKDDAGSDSYTYTP